MVILLIVGVFGVVSRFISSVFIRLLIRCILIMLSELLKFSLNFSFIVSVYSILVDMFIVKVFRILIDE